MSEQEAKYFCVRHPVLGNCWALDTPYTPEFVHDLKIAVDKGKRLWDDYCRRWLVRGWEEPRLVVFLQRYYKHVRKDKSLQKQYGKATGKPWAQRGGSRKPIPSEVFGLYATFGLIPAVDEEVLRTSCSILLSRSYTPEVEYRMWAAYKSILELRGIPAVAEVETVTKEGTGMDKYNVPLRLPPDMKCPGCGADLIMDDGPPLCPVHGTEFLESGTEDPAGDLGGETEER